MSFLYNHTIFGRFCLHGVCLISIDFVQWVDDFADFVGLNFVYSTPNLIDVIGFYFVNSVVSLVDFCVFDFTNYAYVYLVVLRFS